MWIVKDRGWEQTRRRGYRDGRQTRNLDGQQDVMTKCEEIRNQGEDQGQCQDVINLSGKEGTGKRGKE